MHPPPSPARAYFTLMIECTPESSGYYSVYSVAETPQPPPPIRPHLDSYSRTLLTSKEGRRHLFVPPELAPQIPLNVERLYCKRPILWLASSKILTPPPPSPPGECVPPAFGAGEDTLAGWRGGWGVNILEDARHSPVLYIHKYFVPLIMVAQPLPNDITKAALTAAGATTVKYREMLGCG